MDKKSKLINIRISPQEYDQVKKLAEDRGMGISQYVRHMATIFLESNFQFNELSSVISKKRLEKDLLKIAKNLEQRRKHIDMLLRSVNFTALKLESQFKKYRLEAAKELDKDFQRIDYLFESSDEMELPDPVQKQDQRELRI